MKNVMFLCVENRARSQIAEGLARHFIGHQYDVFSAGSQPADRIHPMAVAVMGEIGIDISKQKPKEIGSINLGKIELVITLCADEICPTLPAHTKHERWEISDPAKNDEHKTPELQLKTFRKIRDQIRQKVLTLRAADQTW